MMQSFWINFFKTFLVDKHLRRLENVPPFGGVPEWPKGSDCKSDAKASVVRIHLPPPNLVCGGSLCHAVMQLRRSGGLQAEGLESFATRRGQCKWRTARGKSLKKGVGASAGALFVVSVPVWAAANWVPAVSGPAGIVQW